CVTRQESTDKSRLARLIRQRERDAAGGAFRPRSGAFPAPPNGYQQRSNRRTERSVFLFGWQWRSNMTFTRNLRDAGATVPLLLFLASIAVPSLAGQTTINLSRDLVPLGIASQNMVPNSSTLDAQPLFMAAMQYIQNNPVQVLTADPGAY